MFWGEFATSIPLFPLPGRLQSWTKATPPLTPRGRKFCDWVETNEPTTYTYCVMTRPKAPNEVLLFERYADLQALGVHGTTKEFKAMFRATGPFIRVKETVLSEWEELDGSFVSNQPGGAGVTGQAKL